MIEIVCHKDWIVYCKNIVAKYGYKKIKWICEGGSTFLESNKKGLDCIINEINKDDIIVISFGSSPLTPNEDIIDSINVAKQYGNGIASKDIDLCTCIKDNEFYSSKNLIRETIKGFSNPWSFKAGELIEVFKECEEKGIIKTVEQHTTSLYFALNKKIYFSKSTTIQTKITSKTDIDVFEGILLKKEKELC